MPKISMNMITQRSIEEGAAMEKGKTNPDYFDACSIIELNPEDMKKAGIKKSANVRVVSECGSVIVKASYLHPVCATGSCSYSPGRLGKPVPPRTQSTGTPRYSGFPVTIEPAPDEKLKTALELVQGSVGLWRGGN